MLNVYVLKNTKTDDDFFQQLFQSVIAQGIVSLYFFNLEEKIDITLMSDNAIMMVDFRYSPVQQSLLGAIAAIRLKRSSLTLPIYALLAQYDHALVKRFDRLLLQDYFIVKYVDHRLAEYLSALPIRPATLLPATDDDIHAVESMKVRLSLKSVLSRLVLQDNNSAKNSLSSGALCLLQFNNAAILQAHPNIDITANIMTFCLQYLQPLLQTYEQLIPISTTHYLLIVKEVTSPLVIATKIRHYYKQLPQQIVIMQRRWSLSMNTAITLLPTVPFNVDQRVTELLRTLNRSRQPSSVSRFFFVTEHHQQVVNKAIRLAKSLPAALERQYFQLAYQPIVNLYDERIVGYNIERQWQNSALAQLSSDAIEIMAEDHQCLSQLVTQTIAMLEEDTNLRQQTILDQGLWFSLPLPVSILLNKAATVMLSQQLMRMGAMKKALMFVLDCRSASEFAYCRGELRRNRQLLDMPLVLTSHNPTEAHRIAAQLGTVTMIQCDLSGLTGLSDRHKTGYSEGGFMDILHHEGVYWIADGVTSAADVVRAQHLGCRLGQGCYYGQCLNSTQLEVQIAPNRII